MALKWEDLKSEMMVNKGIFLTPDAPSAMRAKVPGGWFVQIGDLAAASAFFYTDPEHLWDGTSLP